MTITNTGRRSTLAALLAAPWIAKAQPRSPYSRIIVPGPAGGVTDLLARPLAKRVSQTLSRQLIVENRPGADGAIGGNEVLRSPKDGTTIFFASTTSMSAIAALRRKPPYDPVADFDPIVRLGFYSAYLYTTKALALGSLAELVEHGRKHPNALRCGTSHATARLACAQLQQLYRFPMVEVPYKGEQQMVPDLVDGRIELTFASPASMTPLVDTGKLNILATLTPARTRFYPALPTMGEAGSPGFINAGWAALFTRKGVPIEERRELAAAFTDALKDPDVLTVADQIQFSFQTQTPEELGKFLVAEESSFKQIVAASGIATD